VPVVVSVPLLLAPAESLIRTRKSIFEWLGGFVLGASVLAAELFVYLHP
jgi:hypothetical protein